MLARSGAYAVKSRLVDDDKQVWLDFEWGKLCALPTRVSADHQDSSSPRSGRLGEVHDL
jgi:hypothetical protein